MSILSVYPQSSPDVPNKVLTHHDDIASTLAEQGVRFERRQASVFEVDAIAAHSQQVDSLMTGQGYVSHTVLSHEDEYQGLGEEFSLQAEELCWFVAGRGQVNLHIEDYVYSIVCEKHDLVVIPSGTRRWVDLGEHPRCVAIRMFAAEALMAYTGDRIAEQFAGLDD
ncbi:Acireductone dioxygenase [Pseudomonas fluorescens]|uniref:acireductone dioxygenase n=1 Tax=Pseudomonas fluorescens TaxID=294 RepID=UPI0012541D32|nr:acireductone dioxygenase [Pseudomonas fluorescens]CAG8865255.1 Acireductone dioxygenase [Pseudomonas fluorescens]VVP66501.1 Acireductone dioxygenase [Pseudomonas fluorescens]